MLVKIVIQKFFATIRPIILSDIRNTKILLFLTLFFGNGEGEFNY